jgi:hypothetical protein
MCECSSLRVADLVTELQSNSNLPPLLTFMRERSDVQNCASVVGALETRGTVWYDTAYMPNVVVCECCFMEHLLATRYTTRFEESTNQQ